ncbi:hypothetical protein ACIQCR_21690 [Streptomyces sp. NPDC093249]|uniref:hypothetical protein n=1 Tax=unclassified Streptomyces TaxID=2593676 RepID=UPI00344F0B71
MEWGDYRPFQPLEDGPMGEMPLSVARREYDHRMATKAGRLAALAALAGANGLRPGTADEDLDALEGWYLAEVEPDADGSARPRPLWIAVAYDLGLYLGDTIVARAPGLSWTFYRSREGARDVSHQHPVIMGFTRLRNKRYNVDPFLFAAGTGGSSLGGHDARGSFRRFVDSAVGYA